VRSRLDIYKMLRESAERGLAVVIVSSDAAELAGLCDRVVVLSRGKVVAELSAEQSSEDTIVHAFAGHESKRDEAAGAAEAGAKPGAAVRERLRGFVERHQDLARLSLLALMLVLLGAYTQSRNDSSSLRRASTTCCCWPCRWPPSPPPSSSSCSSAGSTSRSRR